MKALILTLVVSVSLNSFAATEAKSFNFRYKTLANKAFTITKKAASHEAAFKLAAADCFSKLTNNKYPGEEKGLEIIDICANPKM